MNNLGKHDLFGKLIFYFLNRIVFIRIFIYQADSMARTVFARRQASEQYFTSSQFFAQALRQTISRPQTEQGLLGK
jgi:hypothetical protein